MSNFTPKRLFEAFSNIHMQKVQALISQFTLMDTSLMMLNMSLKSCVFTAVSVPLHVPY